MPLTRRQFLIGSTAAGGWLFLAACAPDTQTPAPSPSASPSPPPSPPSSPTPTPIAFSGRAGDIAKYAAALLVPPVMPRARVVTQPDGTEADEYEISLRQFEQQVLPPGYPVTTVWGYGPVTAEDGSAPLIHNAPSLTIEARRNRPVRVKWINDLVDENGDFLPHLLPVDQTLHWANPGGGTAGRDTRPMFQATPPRYEGPVPMVVHVHGAVGVGDESDGYAEAWFLPAARNVPAGYATEGTWYEFFAAKALDSFGAAWGAGYSVHQYPNADRASMNWYHDHTLGITRLNVYAGPAGFYLVRGGPPDLVVDDRSGAGAVLPAPAPAAGDPFPSDRRYFEIPLAIQDRSFNPDGSLFYPESRAAFDGIVGPYLPESADDHEGISPIWNPEYFGHAIIVNGATWPYLDVEQRRYRFRVLNGCQSRFLILDFSGIPGVEVWQIGNEGGFLARPVDLTADHAGHVLLAPAERADIVVDFTGVPTGEHVLRNIGPDEPFGGGEPGDDFEPANPETTGQVLQVRVGAASGPDPSTPPRYLRLPAAEPLPAATRTRPLSLMEKMAEGRDDAGEEIEGPAAAALGTVIDGWPIDQEWAAPVTESPGIGDTEIWEFFNATADAHPIHIHEVSFEVVEREGLAMAEEDEVARPFLTDGRRTGPEPWETGRKDTVIAYPGQVTRVKARFERGGQYLWHCHILEHEDNEMMRPFRIGPPQDGQPASSS